MSCVWPADQTTDHNMKTNTTDDAVFSNHAPLSPVVASFPQLSRLFISLFLSFFLSIPCWFSSFLGILLTFTPGVGGRCIEPSTELFSALPHVYFFIDFKHIIEMCWWYKVQDAAYRIKIARHAYAMTNSCLITFKSVENILWGAKISRIFFLWTL